MDDFTNIVIISQVPVWISMKTKILIYIIQITLKTHPLQWMLIHQCSKNVRLKHSAGHLRKVSIPTKANEQENACHKT